MRKIHRVIVSAVILSSDGKLLMGRKDPAKGGVYTDAWHIPGGGVEVDNGETLDQAIIREVGQEVVGLDAAKYARTLLPFVGKDKAQKTLESGEIVWVKMDFNRFEIRLNKTAAVLEKLLQPGDDLVKLAWFSRNDLRNLKLVPGGREFFIDAGYMEPSTT